MTRSVCRTQSRFLTLVAVVASIALAQAAMAQRVLNVPSEYPTIQAGIDAAVNDDTVLVAEGAYSGPGNVDLNFNGKAITVRGANNLAEINDSAGGDRLVTFDSGETSAAVLEGFIVQFDAGAGIFIDGSSPTIRNCQLSVESATPLSMNNSSSALSDLTITGRVATLTVVGGRPTLERVHIEGTSLEMSDTTVTLADCSAANNRSGRAYTGGGMSFRNSTASLARCTIRDNVTFGDEGYDSFGGGVYVEDSVVNFDECRISDNEAYGHFQKVHGDGGGAYVLNSEATFHSCEFVGNIGVRGSGVYVQGGNAVFSRCDFRVNLAWVAGGGAYGGGTFEDCVFSGNFGQELGGGAASQAAVYRRCSFFSNNSGQNIYEDNGGGGLWSSSAPTIVVDSLFVRNGAGGEDARGGGMRALSSDVIRGCTFVANYAQVEGGGISFQGQSATVGNSIIRENRNASGDDQTSGSAMVTWSNVQDGYPGEGNIDLDPRFVDPASDNYRLGNASPCIDAGNNALVPPESEFDLDGNARLVDDLGMPEMGEGSAPLVDIGCYEFQDRSTGLNLRAVAPCPDGGSGRFGFANATPQGDVALLFAQSTGRVRIPQHLPCAGTRLGLGPAALRLAWRGSAGAEGQRVVKATIPPIACGGFVQIIDLESCNTSNVVGIH